MSDSMVVAGSFALVYLAAFGYAAYLHIRRKRAER